MSHHIPHPSITLPGDWTGIFDGEPKLELEHILPEYMLPRRWFGSKARYIQAARIMEAVPVAGTGFLVLVRVTYAEGDPETYVLPLAFAGGPRADHLRSARPAGVVAELDTSLGRGVLYDAVWNHGFCHALLDVISQGQQFIGAAGDITASTTSAYRRLRGDEGIVLEPTVHGGEQSNTSIFYGDKLLLKLFRRLETGINPDLEIGAFLTEKTSYTHVPPVAGALEYRRHDQEAGSEPVTLAILQAFVPNQGDAWRYTLHTLDHYFQRVLALPEAAAAGLTVPREPLLAQIRRDEPAQAGELIGEYLQAARLLGRRTAELHLALAQGAGEPAFAPEPFSPEYQRELNLSMRDLTGRIMHLLRGRVEGLPEEVRPYAQEVLEREQQIANHFDVLLERPFAALRTRIHGDYHLGQVLYTGSDFMLIDFEGEPARPLSERRQKRSPLQDVAGMLRSFHYAAYSAYFSQLDREAAAPETLEAWAQFWNQWVSVGFLQTYMQVAGQAAFMPGSADDLRVLLDAYLLEKAVYELGYELNNRPDWVKIPLEGILATLQAVQ